MRLEELYADIQPRIYAFFYVKTNNKEVAEDLTHEVFYQAMKSMGSFSGSSSVQTWLFAIAKNQLHKYFRSKRYKENLAQRLSNELSTEIPKDARSPEQELLKKEEQHQIVELISQLDPISKEIVTLRVYGELSFKEIGELIGKSENYTRVTFHRAKLKMHKELEGYDEQTGL